MQLSLEPLVKAWIKAYEEGSIKKIMSLYSSDESSFHFGTGADEQILGPNQMKLQLLRDFCQSEKRKLKLGPILLENLLGNLAFIVFSLDPTISQMGKEYSLPTLRCTLIAIKKKNQYKIFHTHASWAVSNQASGDSFCFKS